MERPRTLADARKARPTAVSAGTPRSGGVKHYGRMSVDVGGTFFEEYDRRIFALIEQRWCQLRGRSPLPPITGHVTVEFNLQDDGCVTELVVKKNRVGRIASLNCEQAVWDSAPFGPWSDEMRRWLGATHRHWRIRFEY